MSGQDLIVELLIPAVKIAVVLGVVSLVVAYLTLLERKVLGFMQLRLAPRRVGPHGLLQPIADGIKLLIKEDLRPDGADKALFVLAPILSIIPAFAALAVLPFASAPFEIFGYTITPFITDVNIGVLYILAITSLGVFGIILGGWSSNSKYSVLGSLRSAAQMVSYEVPLGLAVIGALMMAGTASMVGIVEAQRQAAWWFFVPQIIGLFCYFISAVAETNRIPFDLPEAEAELVAGYQTEYAGMKFAFFMMAEYVNMIVVASVAATLWFGGWMRPFPNVEALAFLDWLNWAHPALSGIFWFSLKVFLILYVYIWLRGTFPRYRYDQLMRLGWKWLLPLSLANILLTGLLLLLTRQASTS
ncbi:MAG TPA: NADH-quinone oxidoreductase subunit NuoH [Candidatus Polarisedimenticolia bacterium]|nr:NADH-quinone oxidoreductase subunit NuoH [Candidatus Polarisedimenticolia bacterium]